MSNMIDLKFIEFLNNNKLSAEEFIILYLIYKDKQEENVNEKFQLYVENNAGKFDYKQLLNNLEDKDYLINLNKKDVYELSKLKVTDKFSDLLFVSKDIAFEQVQEIYPKTIIIREKGKQDRPIPSFGNEDIDAMLYFNFINGRRDKHIRFLAITEQYNEINGGIAIYKFENYILNFSGIALMLEEQNKKEVQGFDIIQ